MIWLYINNHNYHNKSKYANIGREANMEIVITANMEMSNMLKERGHNHKCNGKQKHLINT